MEKQEKNIQKPESVRSQKDLQDAFAFRPILPEEADQAAEIEQICFSPNEACAPDMMRRRVAKAPDLFLVAVDRQTGKLAGFLNGLATNEEAFRDAFFTNAELHDPQGSHIMLLGLDVLPAYRMRGLARELVRQYQERQRKQGRKRLLLTCAREKVEMYRKFGFVDEGIANSTWGGEVWHQMSCRLNG